MSAKIPVAVLGATGSVGQRFLALLADHPWFEVRVLTASQRSSGKPYAEAVRWLQTTALPEAYRELVLQPTEPASVAGCPLVFSALGSSVAGPLEPALAAAGHLVVSNAGAHRMDPDVPLVVPEVNPDHIDLARHQDAFRNRGGALLTNPNCSTIGLVLALKPLADAFGIDRLHVTTLQAVSGAGLPGVPGVQTLDNIIPFIPNEEEKVEAETRKILGRLDGSAIIPAEVRVSAHCNRVPVIDGHTACVSVALERQASEDDLRRAWSDFRAAPQELSLPTAPARPVHWLDGLDVPQPRLHRDLDGGMAASVGRLRPCPLLDYKFVTLSHNTLRGAAGGALLLAELAVERGLHAEARRA
ncbi:MAG: aspartate-semialdehyde dehydrogenase [Acidobacteriota bacterium]